MTISPRTARADAVGATPSGWLAAFLHRYWRLILLSFFGWSLLAAIPATSAYLGMDAPGLQVWWAVFKKIGLYYYLWGLLTPLIYRLATSLPYRGAGLGLTIGIHLAVLTATSFLLGVISHQEAWREWLLGPRAVGYHSMSAFTYALIVLCCLAIKYYRLSLLREREASDARIHAAELDSKLNLARVDSLRMQMNPHFLFNALNSIAALIDSERKDDAYEALEQLGDLLRQALKLSRVSEVSLDTELQFSRAYLSLEKIRFGDRLNVHWDVASNAMKLQLPAFILQPLIENAIKHSVSASASPVTVDIRARTEEGELVLEVADDGGASQSSTDSSASGIGISNLRERLRLRFGDDARVDYGFEQEGFRSKISIPLTKLITATSG